MPNTTPSDGAGARIPSRRALIAVGAAVALSLTGCGSRLEHARLEATNNVFKKVVDTQTPAAGTPTAAGTATDTNVTAATGAGAGEAGTPGIAAGSAGAQSSAGGATASRAATSGAAPGVRTTGAGSSTAPGGTAPGASAANAGTAAGKPGAPAGTIPGGPAVPAPGAGGGPKSEILLGSFGAESGVLGAVSGPAPPALRAWSAYINAKGGINGHPVRVILGDDNADPARTLAIVRQMVEQDHVIAFLNDYSFTLSAVTKYLEDKQIPDIGSIGGDAAGDHSAMVFHPLVGPDRGQAWGFLLTISTQTDKKKLGLIYCREAATCAVQMASFKKLLPWNGLESVYEAQVSLAQPDYTAEMLQAQRSGAEVIVSLVDSASVARLAQSAHRQGYNPIFSGTYNLNQDLIYAGGKDVDGLILTSRTPPWDTSPRMQFYRDAMDRYQPKAYRGDLGGGVFVAGKLLEEKIGPLIGEPPTTAQILQGLYALHNETLGGLLPGVGFIHGEHFTTNQCVVPVKLSGGKFVAHDAAESFVCAPGWKPAA
ncbi:MAG: branched-chain amino acid transport system substrate-binding protein [Actinomycetota bacterium]|jgi:branched-chain amino acid transport system substrate-binding protein|nr:branched-chain amino acid transport system substrate-binding protein [Actinomycetota bacterium]